MDEDFVCPDSGYMAMFPFISICNPNESALYNEKLIKLRLETCLCEQKEMLHLKVPRDSVLRRYM